MTSASDAAPGELDARDILPSTWDSTDSAILQPDNLQLTKPLRAWERKPTSPFARSRSRARKIWKRVRAGPSITAPSRTPASTATLDRTPLKASKKLCLAPETAIGTQWFRVPSPDKRIITRSQRSEELMELAEDESSPAEMQDEEEDPDGTLVELLHEDGTLIEDEEASAMPETGWVDDNLVENGTEEEQSVNGEVNSEALDDQQDQSLRRDDEDMVTNGQQVNGDEEEASREEHHVPLVHADNTLVTSPSSVIAQPVAIPYGFATPVRRHRTVSKRLTQASRRRTLPHEFAPMQCEEPLIDTMMTKAIESDDIGSTIDTTAEQGESLMQEQEETSSTELSGNVDLRIESVVEDDENEWEDLDCEEASSPSDQGAVMSPVQVKNLLLDDTFRTPDDKRMKSDTNPHKDARHLPSSSPLDGIKHSNQATPTRKSPRRKSSTSRTQKEAKPTQNILHFVASTPVKQLDQNGLSNSQTMAIDEEPEFKVSQSPLPGQLGSSAELNTEGSPAPKTTKIRLSDDTALLQAFLDRARQDKKSENAEQAESCRPADHEDSETVRHALASSANTGVLAEIDPNSFSPKKLLHERDIIATVEMDISADAKPESTTDDLPMLRPDVHDNKKSSSRAPPRIMLRTSSRRQTEAQELLTLTRNNTRTNKAGAVPPKSRVPQLMQELLELSLPAYPEIGRTVAKVKLVKWMPALISGSVDAPMFEEDENEEAIEAEGVGQAEIAPTAVLATSTVEEKAGVEGEKTSNTQDLPVHSSIVEPEVIQPLAVARESRLRPRTIRSRLATPSHTSVRNMTDITSDGLPQSTAKSTKRSGNARQSRLPAPVVSADHNPLSDPTQQENKRLASMLVSPPKRRSSLFALPKPESDTGLHEALNAAAMQGMTSPAKRVRGMIMFGDKAKDIESSYAKSIRETPGLNSPAKKRARRP